MSDAISVGDHFRGERADADHGATTGPGVYRVVGVGEDRVTLLRLTDAGGRRASTGHVERVSREALAAGFEPTGNPDAGFHPVRAVVGMLDGLYWSLRSLLPV